MNKKLNQGQALIELIIFLPLMITLYSVISGFANSINGSINQQKIVRAYFYNRIQNNSTFPGPTIVETGFKSWSVFGVFFIGWAEFVKSDGSTMMPCYKVNIPFKDSPKDKCEDAYSENKTLWIRVGTVYGVCGTSLFHNSNQVYMVPDGPGPGFKALSDKRSCIILPNN